jgi:hypothetical protein
MPQPGEDDILDDNVEINKDAEGAKDIDTDKQEVKEPSDDDKIIKQKAALFDMIDQDPELSQLVLAKLKGEKSAPKPKENANSDLDVIREDLKRQREEVARFKAQLEIERFATQHSDFEQHKTDIGKLILKHPSLSLEEAYQFVTRSRASGNSGNKGQLPEGKPVAKTTPRVNSLREAHQRLYGNDAKPESFDATFQKAFDLAKAMHDNETE